MASLTYSWAVDMSLYDVRVNGFALSGFSEIQKVIGNPVSQGILLPVDKAPVATYLLSDLSAGITSRAVRVRGTRQTWVLVDHTKRPTAEEDRRSRAILLPRGR
jgi:hypothetical protein